MGLCFKGRLAKRRVYGVEWLVRSIEAWKPDYQIGRFHVIFLFKSEPWLTIYIPRCKTSARDPDAKPPIQNRQREAEISCKR
jgi:hypothetical protein